MLPNVDGNESSELSSSDAAVGDRMKEAGANTSSGSSEVTVTSVKSSTSQDTAGGDTTEEGVDKNMKKKKLLKRKERNNKKRCELRNENVSNDPVPGTSKDVSNEVVKNIRTSTPVKIKGLKVKQKKLRSKRGRFVERRSLQLARRRLEECAEVSLSPSTDSVESRDQVPHSKTASDNGLNGIEFLSMSSEEMV